MAGGRSGYSSKPCPLAGNGWSPQYTALCISIKANGMKQNPITEEQTGGLSAAYCFNHSPSQALLQL